MIMLSNLFLFHKMKLKKIKKYQLQIQLLMMLMAHKPNFFSLNLSKICTSINCAVKKADSRSDCYSNRN